MQATRFWVLACLGAIASAASFSCGSDEGTSRSLPSVGGETADAGAGSFPLAGSGATANGGSSGGGERGGDGPGRAGAGGVESTPSNGGEGGGLGIAGAGGGAPPTVDSEQLELCARLTGNVTHAYNVGTAFGKATNADCRVKWVIPRMQGPLVDYKNELVIWSLELWGCQGLPVDTFALVYETPPLSPGDVTLLIEHYMTATQNELDLSRSEFDEMRAALERLAAPLIAGTSTEPSNSQCVAAGGAGGAAGAGGTEGIAGDSGVAGAPPVAAGGAP